MLSIRSRLVLFGSLSVLLALLCVGGGIYLLRASNASIGQLYESEVRQTRLIEEISRHLHHIDSDIAAVALGSKAPLDAHEYVRRNRPQIELMINQLRSRAQHFNGERLDMLEAVNHNLPAFYQLLGEIDQAYIDSNPEEVKTRFQQSWPIMRVSVQAPLERLLQLQQIQLDESLHAIQATSKELTLSAIAGLALACLVLLILGWRLIHSIRHDLSRMIEALQSIARGAYTLRVCAPKVQELQFIALAVNQTLDTLQEARRNQTEELKRQQLILESITDGVYCLDAHGCISYVNRSAQSQLGWLAREMLGKPAQELLHLSRADGTPYSEQESPLQRVHHEGPLFNREELISNKAGMMLPVELSIVPLQNEHKEAAFLVVFRDISERIRKNADLLQAYREINQISARMERLQNELREAEKLAFYGQLASSIIAPLSAQVTRLEDQLDTLGKIEPPSASDAQPRLGEARLTLAHLAKIVRDLRDYQAPQPGLSGTHL